VGIEERKEIHLLNVSRNIFAVVDATIHGDEFVQGGLLLDAGIVQARVENDDGEGQDVAGIYVFDRGRKSNETNYEFLAHLNKFQSI
jgi:hypothetical protein